MKALFLFVGPILIGLIVRTYTKTSAQNVAYLRRKNPKHVKKWKKSIAKDNIMQF